MKVKEMYEEDVVFPCPECGTLEGEKYLKRDNSYRLLCLECGWSRHFLPDDEFRFCPVCCEQKWYNSNADTWECVYCL